MLILPAKMSPKPLNSQEGKAKSFNCEVCGRTGEGRLFKGPGSKKNKDGEWGVLPEEWTEVPDKRPNAKKKFVVSCSSECDRTAAGPMKT
jgi:hypothetical protein